MHKKFDFTFMDMGTNAALLAVPVSLERINYLLSRLQVIVPKGFFAENHWHLNLFFQGAELVVRVSESDASSINIQAPQLALVAHHMFMTLMDVYAKGVLTTELSKMEPGIVVP